MPVNYICPSETKVSAHSHREKVLSVCAFVLPFIADAVSANPIDHMGMVHLQLSPSEWKKIPDAKAAVQKEYDQLAALPAWDMKNVCEYHQVAERAASTGKTIYFGRIFPLAHIKHSELSSDKHVYKGRVVFGGNNVRDENGVLAVFQEQGTSASHMVCAKFLDAIARMPGCDGQDADACKAYLQAYLSEFEGDTETWVILPEDQWPTSWIGKYKNPVVRLLRNLYGHPLAGLYWDCLLYTSDAADE